MNFQITTNQIFVSILATLLVMGLCTEGFAQQQPASDYEIQQNFKQVYQSLNNELDKATNTDEIREIMDSIEEMEETYSSHHQLLNSVLHPDSFKSKIKQLKDRATLVQNRITTIEEHEERVANLKDQLDAYNNKLASLSDEAQSLREQIEETEQSESQLTSMVQRYRQNLEERDELVLSFVDSIMIAYQNLDIQAMRDLESAQKEARFNADGNALRMIERIASENTEFLNNNSQLSTEAYLRMNAVQKQFSTMWKRVGDKLVRIYEPDNTKQAKNQINNALAEWNEKITTLTWNSLNEAFESSGIDLPEFADSEAFFNAITQYLNDSIEESRGENSQNMYEKYQTFYTFWNDEVKSEWSEYFEEGEILSNRQMATVDQRITQWAGHAEPESNLLIYLLGISVLAIVFMGIMLVRQKSDKKS